MTMDASPAWVAETRKRARLLQDQLARIDRGAREKQIPDALREKMLEPYRALLEATYAEDLPVARLLDEADLVVHVKGQAADAPMPKLTLLTKIMSEFRDAVGDVARAATGAEAHRLPSELELRFTGLARGSLFLGFSVEPGEDGRPSPSSHAATTAIERILEAAPAV